MSAPRFRVLPSAYVQAQTHSEQVRRRNDNTLLIVLFTLPGMVIFFLFVLMPIAQSAYYSLYNWNGFGPLDEFVGLGNYQQLLNHSIFQMSLGHTLTIMSLSLAIQLPLALLLALLVGRGSLRGRKFFRIILFIPYVFSEVITAIIWRYVLSPDPEALLNAVLRIIFPTMQSISWLGDRNIVLYSLFAVLTWKYFGFYMILYMAGLQTIPMEVEDAARVDGATELQALRYVTIPLLGSTIRLTIFLSVLGSFQQFVLTWVLTNQGGPAYAASLFATYLYEFGIKRLHLGYGAAVAVVLFVITLTFSLGYQRIVMQRDYELDGQR